MIRQLTIVITAIATLLVIVIVGRFLLQSSERLNIEENPSIIIPSEEVARLPGTLTAPIIMSVPPISLSHIPSSDASAIIISKATLNQASTDVALKNLLITIAQEGHVVLVYNASVIEIARALELSIPISSSPTNTQNIASSIVYKDGIPIVGSIIVSTDNPSADDEILRDIKDHIISILKVINESR